MPQQPTSFSAYGFSGSPALLTNSAVNISLFGAVISVIETAKNANANDCYLLLYNAKAANVVVGTTVPSRIVSIVAGTKGQLIVSGAGMSFPNALSAAMVMTTPTGNTAPSTPFGVDIVYQ